MGTLTSTTTYNYKVLARKNDGISNYSSEVSITPDGSTAGEVDATAPTIISVVAPTGDNLGQTTATITVSASDDSGLPVFISAQYEQSSSFPASYSKESAKVSAITSGSSGTVILEGLTSNTKYYYKVRARDASGNIQSDDNSGVGYYFTTNRDTTPPTISFNSATGIAVAASTAKISWSTTNETASGRIDFAEDTSSGSDCSGLIYTTGTAGNGGENTNLNLDQSLTLAGLSASTKYCFKIIASDGGSPANPATDDNSGSYYTFTTLPAPPTISGVSFNASPAGTTLSISWNTTQKSSSLIDYGTTLAYGATQGNPTDLVTAHSVTLVGLASSTSYKFRVKSVNQAGDVSADDNSGQGHSFTSGSAGGPGGADFAISSVVVPSESAGTLLANTAVITWTTNYNADGLVMYGTGGSYNFEAGDSSLATSHVVTLKGLAPNTAYNFKVKSRSGANLDAPAASYDFTTLEGTDFVPPIFSGEPVVSSASSNKATITWITNEDSNSRVEFGLAAGSYTSVQGKPSDSVTSHSIELLSLTPDKLYYFQVISADAAGNKAIDNNGGAGYTFETTTGAAVDCPVAGRSTICPVLTPEVCPVIDIAAPKISNIKISDITFNTAAVNWETDEDANSLVAYDTVSEEIKKVFDYSAGQSKEAVKQHKVVLRSLDSDKPYFFRVSSTDSHGNTADSAQQTFTTISITQAKDKGAATADSLKKQFEDIAKTLVKDNLATEENIKDIISRIAKPPIMGQEGPVAKDIKSYGATIIWTTDRKANSIVKFTVDENTDKPLASGTNWREISKTDTYDTKHEVSLLGLAPSTTYSFQVLSQDILGNIASSDIKTFTTSSSSSIFNVLITDLGLKNATINWETANLSSSSLEWGLEATYGNYKDKAEEKVKKHSIILENLSSGATYHYRVRSVEEAGAILVSDDYTFTTPELPQITKYILGEVKDNAVNLIWTSNIPIDANIRYINKENNETKVQVKEEKTVDHSLTISNLEAGKTYSIEIQGRDAQGNLASVPAFDVQTGMDVIAPEISQVRSQSAIISGGEEKVQAIISWKTNELSSTQILWDLGSTKGDTFANETKLDANLTTNHIAVVTQFKPGMVYRYRVISIDKFGNIATSPDYTILTPVKRQSIIQMIVNQFESMFGWMSRFGR